MAKKAMNRRVPDDKSAPQPILVCTPKRLPKELIEKAATHACSINPLNFAPVHRLTRIMPGFSSDRMKLAVVTTKYWGVKGVRLSVAFLDDANSTLRRLIL